MGLRDWLVRLDLLPAKPEERDILPYSLAQYITDYFTYGGNQYGLMGLTQTYQGSNVEPIAGDFAGLTRGAYYADSVVFACMLARLQLFAEARFMFRRRVRGRAGEMWSDDRLRVLERPWPNGTTGDLLTKAITDADLAGNSYTVRSGDTLNRLMPHWVSIVLGSPSGAKEANLAYDAEVAGYLYYPGGPQKGEKPIPFLVEDVAHFAPIPDPLARFRGMSWLTPVIREIQADLGMTDHKQQFLNNGATPNMIVKFDRELRREDFQEWVKLFEERHTGVANAYKTLFLGGGADATPVGSTFQQLEFKQTQGAGETRIAAAAGVPPVIVGLSEGLQAATYSNYAQARRRFADGTMKHLWRNMAGALGTIIAVPGGSELWYDERDISYLREDEADRSNIQSIDAQAIKALVDAGYESDAVVNAVTARDLTMLEGKHTGLFSVQLQAPGSTKMPTGEAPGEKPVAATETNAPVGGAA